MSFDVGDKVVYPHHGAAIIERREKKEAFGEKREYLVLRLAYGDLTLMVPADNTDEVGLREVINDEEVEEVFAVLRKKEARMPTNWSRRFKNHVEKLKSGDIYQVAEVVRNLSIREKDKGLSAGEKRMLHRARQILVSELTFALDVDEEAAEARLDEVLKGEDQPPAPDARGREAGQEGRREEVGGPPCRFHVSGRSSSPPVGASASAVRSSSRICGRRAPGRPRRRRRPQACDGVVLVVPADGDWHGAGVDRASWPAARRGPTSVRAGLGAVPAGAEIVVVHDAARPLATAALFDAVIDAVRAGADGAVPGARGRRHGQAGRRRAGRGDRRPRRAGRGADAAGVPGRRAARRARRRAPRPPTTPRWSRRSGARSSSSPASRATSRSPTPPTWSIAAALLETA